jgi:tetratricopeptide (TPR) repeat protein
MAQKNLKDKEAVRQENIEQTVSATEQFYNEHKKMIWGALAAILVIVLGILAYQKFIYQPKCAEAMEQSYPAEMNFQAGEYDLALSGDGNNLGFEDIIAKYGTKGGESVYLYAGACALQLGQFDKAIEYFKKYDGGDKILLSRAQAGIGDALVGLEDYKGALAAYEKAAATVDDLFAAGYLLKAGMVAEEMGDKDKALSLYKEIKDQYPQAPEAMDIDKYITRIEF